MEQEVGGSDAPAKPTFTITYSNSENHRIPIVVDFVDAVVFWIRIQTSIQTFRFVDSMCNPALPSLICEKMFSAIPFGGVPFVGGEAGKGIA